MERAASWKELTLREKIGQTVVCLSEKDKHIAMCGSVEAFLKKYPKKVCIVGVTPDDGQYKDLCLLKTEFEKYGCQVTMQRNIWTADAEQAARENDLLLFALCRTPHHPIGPMDFWGEEATSVWSSNCCDKTKTVVASFGSPYFYKYYTNSGTSYINAYSSAPHVVEAFVKAVLGKIPLAGKTPVKLN